MKPPSYWATATPTPSFVPFKDGKAPPPGIGARAIARPTPRCRHIEFHANLLYSHQVKELEEWTSKEVAHSPPAKAPPIISPAQYALTLSSRPTLRPAYSPSASPSSPAQEPHGTPTRWARPSS